MLRLYRPGATELIEIIGCPNQAMCRKRRLGAPKASGELWWYAELLRLKGELIWRTSDRENKACNWIMRALDFSRAHRARTLEVRAATSLARLWTEEGERKRARDLDSICAWFAK